MVMPPFGQKKGKLGSLVYKIPASILFFVFRNIADPGLLKQDEIQNDNHLVARFTAIKFLKFDRREGRIKLQEQLICETSFDLI